MASNLPGTCCTQGFPHDGSLKGETTQLFGIETYVTGDAPITDRVLVIMTDIFGLKLKNNKLVADSLAAGGYKVLVPDILFGDALEKMDGSTSINEWKKNHSVEKTDGVVVKFMEALKKEHNPKFIGVLGYCFGAKYALHQIHETTGFADAAAIAHPSYTTIEEVAAIGKKPLLISAAENDPIYTTELRHLSEQKLKEIGATYQQTIFSGTSHGFAIRGDESIRANVYAKQKVILDQLYWFDEFSHNTKECCKKH